MCVLRSEVTEGQLRVTRRVYIKGRKKRRQGQQQATDFKAARDTRTETLAGVEAVDDGAYGNRATMRGDGW